MRYNYNDGSLKIDLDEELDMKACKTKNGDRWIYNEISTT